MPVARHAAFCLLAAFLVSGLYGATNYVARPDKEQAFIHKFGDSSRRTWNDKGTILLSLVGITTRVDKASTSPEAVLKALVPFLKLEVSDLMVRSDRMTTFSGSVHYEFRQVIKGRPVENTSLMVDVNRQDQIIGVSNQTAPGLQVGPKPLLSEQSAKCFAAAAFLGVAANCDSALGSPLMPEGTEKLKMAVTPILYAVPPVAREAWAVELRSQVPLGAIRYVIDARGGSILETRDRIHRDGLGRIFDPNPFVDPSIRSYQDVRLTYPPYENVPLPRLDPPVNGKYRLQGKFVHIVDKYPDPYFHDDITSTNENFNDVRGTCTFASVMAYYHIDTLQQYVQDLGFNNIANRPIEVDVRGNPLSFSSRYQNNAAGTGDITFGYRHEDGKVFQAEDGDVVAHEYGHALQAALAYDYYEKNGTKESLAMREGFADYWATSYFFDKKIGGLDPYCMGAWIERSTGSGNRCKRVINPSATARDFSQNADDYDNATVWTAVLLAIRDKLGRRMADSLVLRSHGFVNDAPDFKQGALAVFKADTDLNKGQNTDALCTIFTDRGFLVMADCPPSPH